MTTNLFKKKNKSVLLVVLWQWYAFRVLFTCIQVKFMSLFLFYCLLLRSQTAPRFQHTWLPHRSCQCLGREPVAWFWELLLFWMPKFKYKQHSYTCVQEISLSSSTKKKIKKSLCCWKNLSSVQNQCFEGVFFFSVILIWKMSHMENEKYHIWKMTFWRVSKGILQNNLFLYPPKTISDILKHCGL